jgi:hypothetical protein
MPDSSFAQMYVQLQTLVLMADSGEHRFGGAGTKPRCRFSGYCSAEPLRDSLLDINKTLLVV